MKCPYVIKICTKCKRILVANTMNFCRRGDGLYPSCKTCKSLSYKETSKKEKEEKLKENPFKDIDKNKTWNNCPFCIKVCSKCKKILVANESNFNKAQGGKWGLRGYCKKCEKMWKKHHYEDNKVEIRKKEKERYDKNKEKIAKMQKDYYENNKEKRKEYQRQYRELNEEKVKKRQQRYYENNKDKISKYKKQYRKENSKKIKECKKKYYEENKEEILKKNKEYRETNPHIALNNHVKRRALEENQGNGITKEQWFEMMEFFDWKCAYSNEYIGGDSNDRTIDHIIPLSKGGDHEVWNCVPMYASYNYSKHTNDMLDWYMKQSFFDIDRLLKIYEWMEYAWDKWAIK